MRIEMRHEARHVPSWLIFDVGQSTMSALQALFVPIGAVTAAIIAGLFSYLALVISKEQKTSEFRQAWVDALRAEIADLIAGIRIIRYTAVNLKKEHGAKVPPAEQTKAIGEPYEKVIIAHSRILLRLNPNNESSANLIAALKNVRDAMADAEFQKATDYLDTVRYSARIVLKEEWERVKRGETIFTWSKRVLAGLIIASTLGLIALIYSFSTQRLVKDAGSVTAPIMEEKTPNKAPEPTPGAVTPRATEGESK